MTDDNVQDNDMAPKSRVGSDARKSSSQSDFIAGTVIGVIAVLVLIESIRMPF